LEVRSIEILIRALNEADVKYLIVGGLAVNAYGYERMTHDVDMVIGLERENIIKGLHALLEAGYQMAIPITPEEFAETGLREVWRAEKNMIVLKMWSDQHRRTPVDIFVYEPFDFDQEFEKARRETVFGSVTVPIVSYETLLTMKRESGRARDLLDIQELRKLDPYR